MLYHSTLSKNSLLFFYFIVWELLPWLDRKAGNEWVGEDKGKSTLGQSWTRAAEFSLGAYGQLLKLWGKAVTLISFFYNHTTLRTNPWRQWQSTPTSSKPLEEVGVRAKKDNSDWFFKLIQRGNPGSWKWSHCWVMQSAVPPVEKA